MGKFRIQLSIGLRWILLTGVISGCGGPVPFFRAGAYTPPNVWQTPHAGDLGAINPVLPVYSSVFPYGTSGPTTFQQSYRDFQIVGTSTQAFLLASLYDGSHFRSMARGYTPISAGGSGWDDPTLGFQVLASNNTEVADVLGAFLVGGSLLDVFLETGAPGVANSTTWDSINGWASSSSMPLGGLLPVPGSDGPNGFAKAMVQDSSSNAYLALNVCTDDGSGNCTAPYGFNILFYDVSLGWSAAPSSTYSVIPTSASVASLAAPQVQLLNDGLEVTALYTDTNQGGILASATSQDFGDPTQSFTDIQNVSTAPVQAFSAASDQNGDVLAVYIQSSPLSISCSVLTSPITRNCQYRVYAGFRGAQGVWSTPSQLDTNFDATVTSVYQDATGEDFSSGSSTGVVGGTPFFTPAVAYAGNGKFVAVFAITNNNSMISGIYYRIYNVGTGWDPTTYTLEETPITTGSDQYRVADDFQVAPDGQGNFLLVVHYVLPLTTNDSALDRNYGFKIYPYTTASGWGASTTIGLDGNAICPPPTALDLPPMYYRCWNLKPAAYLFPSGEGVLVFPSADPSDLTSTELRLYSTEYHQ